MENVMTWKGYVHVDSPARLAERGELGFALTIFPNVFANQLLTSSFASTGTGLAAIFQQKMRTKMRTVIKKKAMCTNFGQQRLAKSGLPSLLLATVLHSFSTLPSPVVETLPLRDPISPRLALSMVDPALPRVFRRQILLG